MKSMVPKKAALKAESGKDTKGVVRQEEPALAGYSILYKADPFQVLEMWAGTDGGSEFILVLAIYQLQTSETEYWILQSSRDSSPEIVSSWTGVRSPSLTESLWF